MPEFRNTVVVGSQWGDEGKAKVIDVLAEDADVIIRFQGGANAGHTVVVGDQEFVFHLIPSAIMRPGKVCVIGNGVVLDPIQLLKEIEEVEKRGVAVRGRLWIAENVQIVMPWHVLLDQLKEARAGSKAIGTTGRGIGPAYVDKVARCGIRACDLLDEAVLTEEVERVLAEKNAVIEKIYGGKPLDSKAVVAEYCGYGRRLKEFFTNVSLYLDKARREGKKFLFEGAQATLLDIDHGTYPYVTSSSTVAGGACGGAGVGPGAIEEVVGVVKAYTTRVGNGPFPTELNDAMGDKIRKMGGEFGATTGRPRRCGWFDAMVVRKAVRVNGLTGLAITKLDVLDDLDEVRICVGYRLDGRELEDLPSQIGDLDRVEPIYETLPGWHTSTNNAQCWEDIAAPARSYLERISELSGVPITLISIGPRRDQAIRLH